MEKRKITVTNKLGVHARPSSLLVQTASKFESKIMLKRDDQIINAKSILELLSLGAEYEDILELICDGKDEIEASNAIEKIFKDNFNECYQ